MGKNRRPKVLLIAEAANPDLTSVALIGYMFSRALAEVCDAHFVTEMRNCESIEGTDTPGALYTCIDNRKAQHLAYKTARLLRGGDGVGWTIYTALSAAAYPIFEQRVWERFGRRIEAGEFDLVHMITPLSPITSSRLLRRVGRAGVPYVMGPINGGIPWPKGFDNLRRQEREWLSYIRGLHALRPGLRATRAGAAAIVLASKHTYQEVVGADPTLRDRAIYLPENAIDPKRFPRLNRAPDMPSRVGPLRAAFVGRLVPLKAVDLLLDATVDLMRDGKLELDIIGDGPEMEKLKGMAARQGVADAVRFPGWLAHDQVQERLAQSQVLAFPSIKEFGGGAVLEAMALGLAPVVVDYGGPAELVPPGCGEIVPMGSRQQIVDGYRECLSRLAEDPKGVHDMGCRAQQFVRNHFTWQAKARQMRDIYDWVLGQRAEKPDWQMPFAFDQGTTAAGASSERSTER